MKRIKQSSPARSTLPVEVLVNIAFAIPHEEDSLLFLKLSIRLRFSDPLSKCTSWVSQDSDLWPSLTLDSSILTSPSRAMYEDIVDWLKQLQIAKLVLTLTDE
ncbi:hypothetical protein AC1031_016554 [Aphanomyces cochlioides]|nr:hypothetical protein AC1031_016554 [Aphanomyces cochlioides]